MKIRGTIYRTFKDALQTLGEFQCGEFKCYTLELPDLNNDGIEGNEIRKSCIPEGVYPVTIENHRKFGWCYRVHNVPGRSGILIHAGTHYKHTLGCILPGMDQYDITKDGLADNISSKKALAGMVSCEMEELEIVTI